MDIATTTAFGLTIAYLLPGILLTVSVSFWTPTFLEVAGSLLAQQEATFIAGGFFISLAIGLELNLIRWVVYKGILFRLYERVSRRHYMPSSLEVREFTLATTGGSAIYSGAVDENLRYHQMYGSLSLVLPLLYSGWFQQLSVVIRLSSAPLLGGFVLLEGLTIWGAAEAYSRYAAKARRPATGERHAKREEDREEDNQEVHAQARAEVD